MSSKIEKLLGKIRALHDKYETELKKLNAELDKKFDERIFVMHQPGDGFVYVCTEECYNTPTFRINTDKLLSLDVEDAIEYLRENGG